MKKFSIIKLSISILMLPLMTSCQSLENNPNEPIEDSTNITTTEITTIDEESLIEYDNYTTSKNSDGTFNIVIEQEAVEDTYYTISLMYDDRIIEYVSGDGYVKTAYGTFDAENVSDSVEESVEETSGEYSVTTTESLESLIGKAGKWTFKSTSEGTQYIEIRAMDSYGDIVAKYQFTCIVDTHLEPHVYYTTINFD